MRLLLSHDDLGHWSAGPDGTLGFEALALAYAYPRIPTNRTWVRANFVSTLDGAATGDDGRSGSINTGADRHVFALLRALSDVILIGAGTARSEGYRRARVQAQWMSLREGRTAHPTMVVLSRSGDIPPGLSQARDDAGDLALVTCRRAGADAINAAQQSLGDDNVIVAGETNVDLAAALDLLAARGLQRVLCEGGPHLMGDLTASGRLDELCLTIAPALVGGEHPRITAGPAASANLVPRLLIESHGTILGRWSRPETW